MKSLFNKAVLTGLMLTVAAMAPAAALASGHKSNHCPPPPPRCHYDWIVKYRTKYRTYTPWQSKKFSFLSKSAALRYQAQKRRLGYQTKMTRVGLDYRVSYRRATYRYTWRTRRFTGRNAYHRARDYKRSLERRGIHATMYRVRRS